MGTAQQDGTVGKMSEHDDEPREDFGAPDEHSEQEWEDLQAGDEPEQTIAEAAEADGSAELAAKADKATDAYHKKIQTIFGDGAPKIQCPACSGRGLVWNVDEPTPELVHPDNLATCDACNGYGSVITGSKAPGRETTVCISCSGNGYKTITPQPENVTPITGNTTAYDAQAQAPVMGWMGPDGQFVPLGTPQAGNG